MFPSIRRYCLKNFICQRYARCSLTYSRLFNGNHALSTNFHWIMTPYRKLYIRWHPYLVSDTVRLYVNVFIQTAREITIIVIGTWKSVTVKCLNEPEKNKYLNDFSILLKITYKRPIHVRNVFSRIVINVPINSFDVA